MVVVAVVGLTILPGVLAVMLAAQEAVALLAAQLVLVRYLQRVDQVR